MSYLYAVIENEVVGKDEYMIEVKCILWDMAQRPSHNFRNGGWI
jgi:hypothetical protein